jgi:hypothetical protein
VRHLASLLRLLRFLTVPRDKCHCGNLPQGGFTSSDQLRLSYGPFQSWQSTPLFGASKTRTCRLANQRGVSGPCSASWQRIKSSPFRASTTWTCRLANKRRVLGPRLVSWQCIKSGCLKRHGQWIQCHHSFKDTSPRRLPMFLVRS